MHKKLSTGKREPPNIYIGLGILGSFVIGILFIMSKNFYIVSVLGGIVAFIMLVLGLAHKVSPNLWKGLKKEYKQAMALAQEQHEKARAQKEYKKARATAREELEKAIARAWEQYKKAKSTAWEEFEAWEEYEKAVALAQEEYKKAKASAQEEHQKAIVQAQEEHEKARAIAMDDPIPSGENAKWIRTLGQFCRSGVVTLAIVLIVGGLISEDIRWPISNAVGDIGQIKESALVCDIPPCSNDHIEVINWSSTVYLKSPRGIDIWAVSFSGKIKMLGDISSLSVSVNCKLTNVYHQTVSAFTTEQKKPEKDKWKAGESWEFYESDLIPAHYPSALPVCKLLVKYADELDEQGLSYEEAGWIATLSSVRYSSLLRPLVSPGYQPRTARI